MGKHKRRRAAGSSGPAAPLASRHEFYGGFLGHTTEGTWSVGGNLGELAAIGVDAVYSGVVLIADAVAGSTWGEWRGNAELPASRLVRRPMAGLTRREWSWLVAATMALYNVCPLRLVGGLDSEGVPYSLVPIVPTRLARSGPNLLLDGARVDPDEFMYVRRTLWPTVSPELGSVLRLARETFAAAAASASYVADWWANGGSPVTQITTDQALTESQAVDIRTRWREDRALGPSYPAVLGRGAKASSFGVDLAALDGAAVDRLIASVARYLRLPPHTINAPSLSGSYVYQNTEAAGIDLVRYTVSAYTDAIGDVVSELLPGDYLTARRARLDPSILTRADQLTRYQAWAAAIEAGWMSVDEVRLQEGLGPRELPAPSRVDAEVVA